MGQSATASHRSHAPSQVGWAESEDENESTSLGHHTGEGLRSDWVTPILCGAPGVKEGGLVKLQFTGKMGVCQLPS